jgi:lysozyme family protein
MRKTLAKRALGPLVILIGINMNMINEVMAQDSLQYELNKDATLDHILELEGGYANKSADRGGETMYGITAKTLDDLKSKHGYYTQFRTVRDLTTEAAKNIFADEFLVNNETNYGRNKVALKMTELGVNTGAGNATMIMQRALNDLWQETIIDDDGRMGPGTGDLYQEALNTFGVDAIVESVTKMQEEFYHRIVDSDQTQDVFLQGWLNRAQDARQFFWNF